MDEASIVDVAEIVEPPPIVTCGVCGQPSEGRSHGHSIDEFRAAFRRTEVRCMAYIPTLAEITTTEGTPHA